MSNLSPAVRKLVAWSIVLITTVSIMLYGLLPVFKMRQEARSQYDQKVALIERYHSRLARIEGQSAKDQQTIKTILESGLLLRSSDERLAIAELREYLNASVDNAGAQLESSQDVSRENPNVSVEPVSLEASMTVTLEQLQDILYNLESRHPFLRIEALQVRIGRMLRGSPEIPLKVRLVMTGYIYSGAGS